MKAAAELVLIGAVLGFAACLCFPAVALAVIHATGLQHVAKALSF